MRSELARWVGQGRGDLADQTSIILADIDFDPDETTSHQARAVNDERGFGAVRSFSTPPYFRKYRKS